MTERYDFTHGRLAIRADWRHERLLRLRYLILQRLIGHLRSLEQLHFDALQRREQCTLSCPRRSDDDEDIFICEVHGVNMILHPLTGLIKALNLLPLIHLLIQRPSRYMHLPGKLLMFLRVNEHIIIRKLKIRHVILLILHFY